jgi:CRISPR subtype II RNA-guided endonuclease Cas9/Csn1
MKKILGLDLGTNSVGWAMVNLDEENFTGSIIDLGTRVIPSGGKQLKNYQEGKPLTDKKGNTVSECAARRKYRSSRRNIFRFKMRRDKLLLVLDILGWKPVDIIYKIVKEGKYPKVVVLPKKKGDNKSEKSGYVFEKTEIYSKYERRNRAVNGILTQQELGSVLYQLNQRRGYQDIGLLGQEDDEQTKSKNERELKPNQKKVFLTISEKEEDVQIIEWTKPKKAGKKGKPIFSVKAKYEDGSIFTGTTKLGYFDKRKGKKLEFIIEQDKEKNLSIVSVVTKTGWTKSREENNQSLNGKTIGESLFEYLLNEINSGKKHWQIEYPIRKRTYDRIYYKKEFEVIWEKQKLIIDDVSFEKMQAIAKVLAPNNEAKQKDLIAKGLKWIIKEYIIYYQRPLKGGQRKEARDCPFEPEIETKNKDGKILKIPKKSAPVSHFSFQEYRIWQKINDIRIFNKEKEQQFLSEDDYEKLYSLFCKKEKITQDDILKELYKKEKINFHTNFPEEVEFKGNLTLLRIQKALSSETKEKQLKILNTPHILNQLWQIIQTVKIKEARKKAFSQSKFKCTDENGNKAIFSFGIKTEKTLQALSVLEFEKGYGSLSVKAINKILPLMKRGIHFKPDGIDSRTKEKIQKFINDGEIDKIGPTLFNKISNFNDFYDFQGFRYDEAAELVYGMHTRAKQDAEYKTPGDIKFIKPTELRHPVVEEIINECLKVVRDLWASEKHGKPDIIKIELARDLKNNEKRRKDIFKRQENERKRNEEAVAELKSDKFNIQYPTLSQIERWKLWKDQEKNVSGQSRCVYTNTYISPSDLFYTTGNGSDNKKKYKFQIDHIIPKKRVYDDSYMNKVLVLDEANAEKDKYTAREFMEVGKSKSGKPYPNRMKWDDFVMFANSLPAPKRDRLLMKSEDISEDFIERQKKETQYITRRIILELSKIVGSDKIETTTGGVTNLLKQQWGLNDIFKRTLKIRYQEFENKININESVKENNSQVIYVDKDETGNLKINDFTKRIDHRHHALDALAVSCTTRKHVKYLNDKNQLWQKHSDDEMQRQKYENYKSQNLSFVEFIGRFIEYDKNGKEKFRKPWENFCTEVIEELDKILISYKQKKFYHVANVNKFRSKDKNGKPVIKQQKTFAIKGSMHNEQPEGLRTVFTGKYLKLKKLFENLEKLPANRWDQYFYKNFPKSIAHTLNDISKQNNNNLLLVKETINKRPITDRNGNILDELPLTELRIASRISLVGLTEKDWRTIQNEKLKMDLYDHFENNGYSNWDKAFNIDGVAIFNDNRVMEGKMRIDKITVLQNAPFNSDSESANEIIERKNSFNKKSVFKKKENSFTVMYEGTAGREFKQIKLLDFARCINEDGTVDFIERLEGYSHYYLLDTHSFFYMPDENEDGYATVQENNKSKIFKSLYRLNRFSGDAVYYLPHTTTDPLVYNFHDEIKKKDVVINEYAGSTSDSEYATGTSRMIKKFGIPVVVDRIGNIQLQEQIPIMKIISVPK